jgi:hypothetical protein
MGVWLKGPVVLPITLQVTYDEAEGLFHVEILEGEELVFIARYNEKYEAQRYAIVLQSLTELPVWETPSFAQAAG